MAYLRLKDYDTFIQSDNLQQVIRADDSVRLQGEKGAQATITEYLVQKYDLSEQFRDTLTWSFTRNYEGGQLVDLNFTAYSATSLYALNDLVTNAGLSYINTTPITVAEPFTVGKWKLLGSQYDLFYIPNPYPKFNYQNIYSVGDVVFYKGKVYTALKASVQLDHASQIQYSNYNNLPTGNEFPNQTGQKQWSEGVAYSFSGLLPTAVPGDFAAWSNVTTYTIGNRISFDSRIWQAIANNTNISPDTDTTKWEPVSWVSGDNRNPNIVEHYIDCALYKIHKGIAPRNIPDLRVKAYDDAISWLDKCADGRITLDVEKLQPISGNKIRYGGSIKNINSY